MTEEEALISRIREIIEQKRLISSSFAEQIGSSRSVITHILSGRNNPSWDILKKILEKYDDINTEWLLFGKGPMLKSEKSMIKPEKSLIQPSLFDEQELEEEPKIKIKAVKASPIEYHKDTEDRQVEKTTQSKDIEEFTDVKKESKKIVKIMVFYTDSTFESFTPDMKPFE